MNNILITVLLSGGYEMSIANIISLDFDALDRGNLVGIANWGIVSNKGKLVFKDNSNTFRQLYKYFAKDLSLLITTDYNNALATWYIKSCKFNDETSVVEAELTDRLTEWQNITAEEYFPFYTTSLYEIVEHYNHAHSLSMTYSIQAEDKLRLIYVDCPHLKEQSLWSVFTKICEVGQCRIYANEFGLPYLSVDEPSYSDATPIIIEPKHILSIEQRYDNIETKVSKVTIPCINRKTSIGRPIIDLPSQISLFKKVNNDAVFVGADDGVNPDATITRVTEGGTPYSYTTSVTVSFEGVQTKGVAYSVTKSSAMGRFYEYNDNVTPPIDGYDAFKQLGSSFDATLSQNDCSVSFTIEDVAKDPASHYTAMYFWEWVRFALYGNFYNDNGTTNITVSADNGGQEIILPTNELFLNRPNTLSLANEILKKYEQGFYCVELECLMLDFMDENGNVAIVAHEDNFKKYQVVVPYIFVNNQRKPYMTDDNGAPMRFLVVGIKYSYRGRWRQILQLIQHK